MKPQNTQTTGDGNVAVTSDCKTLTPETTVDARLLHKFIARSIPFEQWITNLKTGRCPWPVHSGREVARATSGNATISMSLASFLSNLNCSLAGAVPYVLIDEFLNDPALSPSAWSVNKSLEQSFPLVLEPQVVPVRILHQFLQVGEPYPDWWDRQRKVLKLKLRRDYGKLLMGNEVMPRAARTYEILVYMPIAQRIIEKEKTTRAQRLMNFFRTCGFREPMPDEVNLNRTT